MPADRPSHVPSELARYLLPNETLVFVLRRHWIVLFEPIASGIAGLVLVLVAFALQIPSAAVQFAAVVTVVLMVRLSYYLFEWKHEIFLATDSRLMLVHGLVTRTVDIMPMAKVTDMRYDRSLTGQIFGYGVFVLESAGQDQALSRVNFIPDPDWHYKKISQILFTPGDLAGPAPGAPSITGSRVPTLEPGQAWWRRP